MASFNLCHHEKYQVIIMFIMQGKSIVIRNLTRNFVSSPLIKTRN